MLGHFLSHTGMRLHGQESRTVERTFQTSIDSDHQGQQTWDRRAEAPSSPAAHRGWGRCRTHLSLPQSDFIFCKLSTNMLRGRQWDVNRARLRTRTGHPLVGQDFS